MSNLQDHTARAPQTRPTPAAALFQLLVLSAVFLTVFTWLSTAALGVGWPGQADYTLPAIKQAVVWGCYISVLLLVPLLIGYLVRSSTKALILAVLWVVLFGCGVYAWKAYPTVKAIRQADAVGLFQNSLLLSVWFIPLRLWVWSTVTLVYGFCLVRRRFSMARLLISTTLAGFVFGLISMPVAIPIQLWPAPFVMAAVAWLLTSLPVSRIVLANHFGVPIAPDTPESLPEEPVTARILATACGLFFVAAIAFSVAFSARVNYHEKIQAETVNKGRPYSGNKTAGANGYDVLKERFLKSSPDTIPGAGQPADYPTLLQLVDQTSTATPEQIFAEIDQADWNAYLQRIEPFLQDLEAASHAAYLSRPPGKTLSYLNLREAARALSIRSQFAWLRGRPDDAINDLEVIFNTAALMHDQPTLVEQMIGNALKNIGTHTAENLLTAAHNKPDLLNRLSTVLNNAAPQQERGLNYDALKAGEAGILSGAVIPNIEVAVPAIGRAHRDAQKGQANFQKIRLATAQSLAAPE